MPTYHGLFFRSGCSHGVHGIGPACIPPGAAVSVTPVGIIGKTPVPVLTGDPGMGEDIVLCLVKIEHGRKDAGIEWCFPPGAGKLEVCTPIVARRHAGELLKRVIGTVMDMVLQRSAAILGHEILKQILMVAAD